MDQNVLIILCVYLTQADQVRVTHEFFNILSAYYLYCLNTIDRFIKFSAYDKKELSIRAIQCHYRFIIHYYCPSLSSY